MSASKSDFVFASRAKSVSPARVRRTASAATLIEEDETVPVGIEVASPAGHGARARAAMNHERRLAVWVAALLPIDPMTVADVHQAAIVRLGRRVEAGHVHLFSLSTAQASRLGSGIEPGPTD
jgi:hypothetical protein